MQKPDWFALIEQWKAQNMGEYGVTLPFLVGVLGISASQLLHEITTDPVPGYVTEVRWCAELRAPTLSVTTTDKSKMRFESFVSGPNDKPSVGFSKDLQSTFGLNCKGADDCLKKLADHAATAIAKKTFSRNRNSKTNSYEWGPYSQSEIQFIIKVIGRGPIET